MYDQLFTIGYVQWDDWTRGKTGKGTDANQWWRNCYRSTPPSHIRRLHFLAATTFNGSLLPLLYRFICIAYDVSCRSISSRGRAIDTSRLKGCECWRGNPRPSDWQTLLVQRRLSVWFSCCFYCRLGYWIADISTAALHPDICTSVPRSFCRGNA